MEELKIITITPQELKALIETAVRNGVHQALKELAEERARSPTEDAPVTQWLTMKETAAILQKSRQSCYSFCERGILQPYKLPGVRGMVFDKGAVLAARQKVTFKYLNND
jgi:hypothetical protein